MTNPVALLGDRSSHGGTIVTASARHMVGGKRIALVGDMHQCPIKGHGLRQIVTGSSRLIIGGKQAARTGSVTACGAVIIGTGAKFLCE